MKLIRLFSLYVCVLLFGCSHQPGATLSQASGIQKSDNPETKSDPSDTLLAYHLHVRLDTLSDQGTIGKSLRALYRKSGGSALWISHSTLNPVAEQALQLLFSAREYGLEPEIYGWEQLAAEREKILNQPQGQERYDVQAAFDFHLSRATLRFALHLHQGRLTSENRPPKDSTFRLPSVLQNALTKVEQSPTNFREAMLACQPANWEYRLLQQGLAGWIQQPFPTDSLAYRERRFRQIAINLERWRSEPLTDSLYLLINIPAFQLQVVRNGEVIRSHRVIVGKPASPTPTLRSQIRYFTTSPDWHVPRSIAVNEMLPRIRQNVGYLAQNNLYLYDAGNRMVDPQGIDWGTVTAKNFAYTIRQSAGCDNALGNIVFNFSNPYSVYLHDTPNRTLFAKPQRALSHGCIRLENPQQMAQWLLENDGAASSVPDLENCLAQQIRKQFILKRPIPIHLRYHTVSTEGETLQFHKDLYGLDTPLLNAFALFNTRLP
jgi:L,D-transpeptidase YcbB